MNFRALAMSLTYLTSFTASAQVDLTISDESTSARKIEVVSVTGGGSGCAQSGFELKRSTGKQLARLVFDDFTADATSGSSGFVRKACNLAIQLRIPEGYQVSLPPMIAEGAASTGSSARIQIRSEVWFQRGNSENQVVQNQVGANRDVLFDMPLTELGNAETWSDCSDRIVVRLNLSLLAQAPRSYGEAYGTVEQLKIYDPQVTGLRLRRCYDN
jgi:hypothetical protein